LITKIISKLNSARPDLAIDLSDYDICMLSRANLTFVLYDRHSYEPFLFIKISDNGGLRDSFSKTEAAFRLSPTSLPEPIAFFNISRYEVLVTKAYKMHLLGSILFDDRYDVDSFCSTVIRRLIELHNRSTVGEITLSDDYLESHFLKPAASELANWLSPSDLSLLSQYEDLLLLQYSGLSIPAYLQHCDMNIWNIALRDSDHSSPMFLDWDLYGASHFPLLDITTYVFSLNHESNINPDNLVQTYCDAMNIDAAMARAFLPFTLLLHSIIKARNAMPGGIGECLSFVVKNIATSITNASAA
jgi:hypothetical protein